MFHAFILFSNFYFYFISFSFHFYFQLFLFKIYFNFLFFFIFFFLYVLTFRHICIGLWLARRKIFLVQFYVYNHSMDIWWLARRKVFNIKMDWFYKVQHKNVKFFQPSVLGYPNMLKLCKEQIEIGSVGNDK